MAMTGHEWLACDDWVRMPHAVRDRGPGEALAGPESASPRLSRVGALASIRDPRRRVSPGLLGADPPQPAHPPGRKAQGRCPGIALGDGTPQVIQQRLAVEPDL